MHLLVRIGCVLHDDRRSVHGSSSSHHTAGKSASLISSGTILSRNQKTCPIFNNCHMQAIGKTDFHKPEKRT
ncbi:hypothetical protein JOB18_047171 [Solea senegalensis]|uniref:Uncharacterized protein n=1 Tax=Solea senegalensis TaxID=28829 RepID=A0AAV6QR12_SOLSE|nr:hypothetical protein JOB18_047171 [Solea senegalensis]